LNAKHKNCNDQARKMIAFNMLADKQHTCERYLEP